MRSQYDLIRHPIPSLEHSHWRSVQIYHISHLILVFFQQRDGFQVHLMDSVDSKADRWSLLVQPPTHIWCLGTQALVQNFPWVNDCVWSIKHPRQSNVVQKKANAKSTVPWKNSNISLNLGNPILKNIQKDIYLPKMFCKYFHWFVHVSMLLSKVCFPHSL